MKKFTITIILFIIATASAQFYKSPEENKFSHGAQKFIDTGFKKTHKAFDSLTVVDEWDFIFNDGNVSYDANDVITYQESHGTGCWSIAAGYDPGTFVGPAYGSDFLLAKTEDYVNEGIVEEDRMVAAPLVAGVSCLLLSAHPDWTNMDVREALMMTADRASNPDSTRYGWGLVDALAALNYVHLADPQNVTTSVSGNNLTVSWDAVTNAQSYLVFHSDLPYEGFTYLGVTDQTSYPVSVTSATKKFYYIKASNQEMK